MENLQSPPKLTAKKSNLIKSLLENKKELLKAVQVLPEGHVHVVLPQQITKNIHKIAEPFKNHGISPEIYISHKPTKSKALIKQACADNTKIDVSSKNELISALNAGFCGARICCTGSKNDEYITLSLQHGCLHSLDSIEELKRYIELKNVINPELTSNILLRINSADAPYGGKKSRFGIPENKLDECFPLLNKTPNIHLEGFHMHSGESNADLRGDELNYLLYHLQNAYKLGFKPKTIDIGGALPRIQYESAKECEYFIQSLIKHLTTGSASHTWRNYTYGLSLTLNGSVLGQEALRSHFRSQEIEAFSNAILKTKNEEKRAVSDIIRECGFKLALEPGAATYDQCGVMLLKVIETRKINNEYVTVLDGNVFNFSFHIMEYMSDPILLEQEKTHENEDSFSTYLVGNLCADFDVLVKRKVVLKGKPKAGDYLCFVNTASYTADFHDAPVHQHPMGQKLVAIQTENTWEFMSEDRFNPYLMNKVGK